YSPQAADTVFKTPRGNLAAPARSALGWHVMRVEAIDLRPARELAQVRDELAKEIAADKKRVALTETLEAIEDEFDSGGSLTDVAKTYGLKIETTKPLLSDGTAYGTANERGPAELASVLANAFTMEQEEPQLAEVERGTQFIVYDVTEIAESAAAPLKEIRQDVRTAYIMDKASKAAKVAAEKVQAEVKKGKSLAQALQGVGKRIPPPQMVSMSRPELSRMQQQQQQVPPPLALLFNMAAGTTKVQPAPGDRGWFVVSLTDIQPGKVAKDDPMIEGARRELGQVLSSEYTDALGRAIRAQVGVERNPDGIRAVRNALSGEGG
ncbi:MAG: peptidyl-prolyl cis-trans isomerase, partial [Sphingomonadaceae bacterium]